MALADDRTLPCPATATAAVAVMGCLARIEPIPAPSPSSTDSSRARGRRVRRWNSGRSAVQATGSSMYCSPAPAAALPNCTACSSVQRRLASARSATPGPTAARTASTAAASCSGSARRPTLSFRAVKGWRWSRAVASAAASSGEPWQSSRPLASACWGTAEEVESSCARETPWCCRGQRGAVRGAGGKSAGGRGLGSRMAHAGCWQPSIYEDCTKHAASVDLPVQSPTAPPPPGRSAPRAAACQAPPPAPAAASPLACRPAALL